MQMLDDLLFRLRTYSNGVRTKGGFSDLELFLARLKQNSDFDPHEAEQSLAELVAYDEAENEDFSMGIVLIAEKLGCHGATYRDALERRLFGSDAPLSPRSQYELASDFILCGGDFGPQQLNDLSLLRAELPELWVDLALDAYPLDVIGLTEAVTGLFDAPNIQISWKALKPRYLKLVGSIGSRLFNKFALTISQSLTNGDQVDFLNWVNERRGSQLEPTLQTSARVNSVPHPISMEDIEFLTMRPCLAESVLEQEPVAA